MRNISGFFPTYLGFIPVFEMARGQTLGVNWEKRVLKKF